uniref:Uncharacterized protein n=1 Tax=Arundo donax TaxID=35708 RepID=A0A0A9G5Q5_ARUDO
MSSGYPQPLPLLKMFTSSEVQGSSGPSHTKPNLCCAFTSLVAPSAR